MRSIYVAKRILKQMARDKRSIALLFVAPLFILFLLSVILNSDIGLPKIQTVGVPAALSDALKKGADVRAVSDMGKALDDLKNRDTDAVVTYGDTKITVHVEGSELSVTAAVKKAVAAAAAEYSKDNIASSVRSALQKAAQRLPVPAGSAVQIPEIGVQFSEPQFVYLNGGEDMSLFDSIAPMMMGFFIFFFVFLIAGVAFLRERVSGTLERLLATPIRRADIVLGYFGGFGVFVLLQTLEIQLFMMYGMHISVKGSFLLVLLVNVLLASGSLALGTLLSAFARNEFQLFQFIPVVIVPQILFSGLFSLRGAPVWVVALSKIFPLTYAADALTGVVLRGTGMRGIGLDLILLAAYTVVFLALNSLVLKKYRSW